MPKESFTEFKIAGAFTAARIALNAGVYIDNKLNGALARIDQAYDTARSEVAAENITRPEREDEKKAAAIIHEAARKLSRDNDPIDPDEALTIVGKLPNALEIEAQEQKYNKAVDDHAAKYIDQSLRIRGLLDEEAS